MHNFDLQAHLQNIYASFPQAKRQPIIGLTANFRDDNAILMDRYYRQVVDAGGTPVLIPPVDSVDVIVNTLDNIDGLILTGGADLNALWAGEEPSPRLHSVNAVRDLPELLITRLAYNRQIPHPRHLSWHANYGYGTRRKGGARYRRTFYPRCSPRLGRG